MSQLADVARGVFAEIDQEAKRQAIIAKQADELRKIEEKKLHDAWLEEERLRKMTYQRKRSNRFTNL